MSETLQGAFRALGRLESAETALENKLNLDDNAVSASKLATARTISLTGDVTGSTSFDGSANKGISTTVATMGAATADAAGTKGLVPAPAAGAQGKFLRGDGTWQTPSNTDTKVTQTVTTTDAEYPLLASATAKRTATATEAARFAAGVTLNPADKSITATTFNGALAGNATSASKLETARTISLTGDVTGSASFNGSANVSIATTYAGPTVSVSASRTSAIAASTNYTVPSYVVGKNTLQIYLDGVLCTAGTSGAYQEIGTSGAASTTIQFNQSIPTDMEIKAVVL